MSGLRFLDAALADLERDHLLRRPRSRSALPPGAVWLCSNDYLGLADHELGSTSDGQPAGAGASSLVWGHGPEHEQAERALAAYTGVEACLLFSSGYAANVGVVAALAGRGDLVVSDALNHASLIDGCRLSGARVVVVPHLDHEAMASALRGEARRRFLVTESYFSMDGDGPDLARLAALCADLDAALVVDDAHAIGVLGPGGRGRCAEAGVVPDVLVGTLGKSFGLAGAFVGGSTRLRTWLWNRARSFVFSTAMSPAVAAAVPGRVARVAAADPERAHLSLLGSRLRDSLEVELGQRPGGFGPIIPVRVGSPELAVDAAVRLLDEGWVVQPMRPPTVPMGTSRLRLTVRSTLSLADVDRAASAIGAALRSGGPVRHAPAREPAEPSRSGRVVIAVAGTGTEIGKTHVAAALVLLLAGRGIRVAGRKPIESGVEGEVGADQQMLQPAPSVHPGRPAPYRFAEAISPHLAARRTGRSIEVGTAVEWALAEDAEVVVVESAGGLLSPLGAGHTNLDLVEGLRPSAVILVCPDRLGVLHDVAGCRLALEARGLWSRTVVCANAPPRMDLSSGTNAEELRELHGVPVASWPRGLESAEAAGRTWDLVSGVVQRFT